MNYEERKKFWETLTNVDDVDWLYGYQEIMKTISYPKYLYRYRSIDDYSLDNLRTNTLYFSRASDFDDPFDSYIHVNKEKIFSNIETIFSSKDNIEIIKNTSKQILGNDEKYENFINSYNFNSMIDYFENATANWRALVQHSVRAACFSEDETNRALWLKYGNNHKGFCLMYDLNDINDVICYNKEKCQDCSNMIIPKLYPVYYSKNKFDATKYIEYRIALSVEKGLMRINNSYKNIISDSINKTYSAMNWWTERISLIKEYDHNPDKEWRLLAYDESDRAFYKKWKPYGLILGLNASKTNKVILKALAKEAGIEHVFQVVINKNDELVNEEIFDETNDD